MANPSPSNQLTGTDAAYQMIDDLYGQVPQFEWNKIQDLKCPPPLKPTIANANLILLNQQMQTQKNAISSLQAQVANIQAIYKTQFSVNTVSVYTPQATNVTPQLTVTGSLPNPQLNFTIRPAPPGTPGTIGTAGPPGSIGIPGMRGIPGKQGYWGSQAKI
jgi:hypothetical protein